MFRKIMKFLDYLEEGLNGTLLLAATVILFVNVCLRYFFSASTTWAEEAIRYTIVWVTFVGGSICAKKQAHVGIDIFITIAPPWLSKALKCFSHLSSTIFMVLLAYYSWGMTMTVIQTGQKSPAMLMPIWIVYIALPLGSALMAVRFLELLVKEFRKNGECNQLKQHNESEEDSLAGL